jgi:hypothetical protein
MSVRSGIVFGTAVLVAAAMLIPVSSAADAAVPAPVREVPIRSNYENANRVVSRDDGISVLLPDGHALWLFGDTGIYQRIRGGAWNQTGFIDGSTALQAKNVRGQVPRGGEYPSGVPARFVPVPNDVYLPDGSGRACTYKTAAFPARWPTGAAVMPSNPSEVLVTYSVVCITHESAGVDAIRAEGWGYMLYNWRTRHIDRGPLDVFRPRSTGVELGPAQIYGWPIFQNGTVTLFSSRCTKAFVVCTRGQVWKVTMPATAAALSAKSSYTRVELRTDGSGQWTPLSISVGRYSNGLRLIEMDSIAGTYKIFSSRSLGAAWHLRQSGTLPGCPTRTSFCFALAGHPELSTPTQLFVSYKNPDSGPFGHMVISALAG